jgi:hypothetical protein
VIFLFSKTLDKCVPMFYTKKQLILKFNFRILKRGTVKMTNINMNQRIYISDVVYPSLFHG